MPSLTRNGAVLSYDVARGSGTAVVLVHGWCCDRTYLEPQFRYFAAKGHHVVSVDLRGHGRSDKPEQTYTMQVFADDLAGMSEELGLERPIFIGHSMGGIIVYDLARRYPALPSAIVMLDAAVALPQAARPLICAFLERLRGPSYREDLRAYVESALFIATDDEARKSRILKAMADTPRHVVISAFEGLRDFDPAGSMPGPAVPSLYIEADEPVPRSDISRLLELAPSMLLGKTVGSGHFCQLEVPDQVHAMIERFLKISALDA